MEETTWAKAKANRYRPGHEEYPQMRGSGVRKGMQVLLCVEGGRISRINNHGFGHPTSPPLYRPCTNMGPQKYFSKLFEKVKGKLARGRRK
jgi:hypothetical protein